MKENKNSSIRQFVDSSIGEVTCGRGDRATMEGGLAVVRLLSRAARRSAAMVVAVTLQLFTFTFSLFAATNSFTVANGGAWETGTSVVYPISEGYTGGSVVFDVAGAFELGANAKFDATAAGFRRYDGRSPVTYAPGFGYSYTIGAGYGGYGCRNWTYEAAPNTDVPTASNSRRSIPVRRRVHTTPAATAAPDAAADSSAFMRARSRSTG